MITAFVNTKGGVAKTTSVMMTALQLVRLGRSVTVLDLDPQGSASEWARIAEEDGTPLPFEVRPANVASLRGYKPTTDATLIDTPPGSASAIDLALQLADVVVIPSPAGLMDTDRTWETAGVTAPAVPTYVLVTKHDARTKDGLEFIEALDEQGVARFETVIPARVAMGRVRGTVADPTKFKYDDFTRELLEVL